MNKKDVIIILSGGITKRGFLPDIPKFRIDKGYELYNSGISENIIISGRWSFLLDYIPAVTEAQIMKDYIISLGADEKNIFLEEKSTDTIGNAFFTKQILINNKWNNIVVVTSDFHIERTKYLFSKILGEDTFNVSYDIAPSKLSPKQYKVKELSERKILAYTKEWMRNIDSGNDDQIKAFLYRDHPGYAKNPIVSAQELIDKSQLSTLIFP